MRSPGLRVPRNEGEWVRRVLRERHLLRTDLEIRKEGEFLVLPLREGSAASMPPGEIIVCDFAPVMHETLSDYRELLREFSGPKELLPRSFDVVGDIVLIRLPDELALYGAEIGEALLSFVPAARVVGRDLGVHGPARLRRLERIAGTGEWRTRHRENGIDFEVDVERAYFSPRLAHEHERVAANVGPGEKVLDLCCGVGPFALSIARAGKADHVTAVDSNPAAIELLEQTRARYPFGRVVTPVLAPLESFLPRAPIVGRTILNLPHEGIKYLPSVARTVAPGGSLHYYEITPRVEFDKRAESIMGVLEPWGWSVVDRHVVHPYAPAADLVAYLLQRAEW